MTKKKCKYEMVLGPCTSTPFFFFAFRNGVMMEAYGAVGEQVGYGQLGGEDRILELKLGEVLIDGRLVPVHLSFRDQFTDRRGCDCFCQRPDRRDCLFSFRSAQTQKNKEVGEG